MNVDPHKPFIGTLCFDDLFGLPHDRRQLIISRDVAFLTEFRARDGTYGGMIIAASWERAQEIADGRGLGEKVIGTLTDEMTEEEVRREQDRDRHPHLKRSSDLRRKFGL